MTLLTHPCARPYDRDLVEINEHQQIVRFLSKPHDCDLLYSNLVSAAVYVFTSTSLELLKTGSDQDLYRNVLPEWLNQINVFSYKTCEYVEDLQTRVQLVKLKKDLGVAQMPQRKALNHKKPCVFWDRDGTIVDFISELNLPRQLRLRPQIEEPIKFLNSIGVLNIIVTNQPGIAKGHLTFPGLFSIHKKLETDLGAKGAWIDEIYFCPHHPENGFPGEIRELKIECDCRKPKGGLFLQAQEAFNIDFSKSLVVGDSDRDRDAASLLGIDFVANLDGKGLAFELRPNVFETSQPGSLTGFFAEYFRGKGVPVDRT